MGLGQALPASSTPLQGPARSGSWKRRWPRGGLAYGIFVYEEKDEPPGNVLGWILLISMVFVTALLSR